MKTDYTITPEYQEARCEKSVRCFEENARGIEFQIEQAYCAARRAHADGEPLIRTTCKIAARILFVLLLVGIGIGVLLK